MARIGIEAPEDSTKLIKALEGIPQGITPVIFGPREQLRPLESRIKIVDCPTTFSCEDTLANRAKLRRSSIFKAIEHHSKGLVDVVLALNNTTGAIGATLGVFKKAKRYAQRPCLVSTWPNHGFLADSGATVDCTPQQLIEFAIMGTAYIEKILGKDSNPEIGLLTNGKELTKGNRLIHETRKLLEEMRELGYNIPDHHYEPYDLLASKAEYPRLAVCDGYIGNITLKMAEHTFRFIAGELKRRLLDGSIIDKIAGWRLRNKLRSFKQEIETGDHSTAPLLGIEKANILVCHGAAEPNTIEWAIKMANTRFGDFGITNYIKGKIGEYNEWKKNNCSSSL